MFIDKNKKPDIQGESNPFAGQGQGGEAAEKKLGKIPIIIITSIVVVLAALVIFLFLYQPKVPPASPGRATGAEGSPATGTSRLPGLIGGENDHGFQAGNGGVSVRAETITFGQYAEEPEITAWPEHPTYGLPLNIKADTVNFYDLNRKYSLDSHLDGLNSQGFKVVDNPFAGQADDFYSFNRALSEEQIPLVVTGDMLMYYFQNEIKQVYADIKSSTFYNNVWEIYKQLYDIALTRYKKTSGELGLANDTLLEAQRMQTAYLAVLLELLSPEKSQVRPGEGGNSRFFSESEAAGYTFSMPDDIRRQVTEEKGYIAGHGRAVKSKILLYPVDYGRFAVPAEYAADPKGGNFYLATQWLQLPWPLYSQSEQCPDCPLDYNDWLINMAAAAFLADDLDSNQELKNKWAVVYKFVAFFTGLEKDLTYLDYTRAYRENFGQDWEVESIFDDADPERRNKVLDLQAKLAEYRFPAFDGAKPREPGAYPEIGMRLLQDFYWPNTYILERLTGQDMPPLDAVRAKPLLTACADPENQGARYRCIGHGQDIISVIAPLQEALAYDDDNIKYVNYGNRLGSLQDELGNLGVSDWHDNVFWTSLDIFKDYYNYPEENLPAPYRLAAWKRERDRNSVLGAWVNIHLPYDNLQVYSGGQTGAIGSYSQCNEYDFIEPRPDLINAMRSKIAMLSGILDALGVAQRTSAASIQLRELDSTLLDLRHIMVKELAGTEAEKEDCETIGDFARQFSVSGQKTNFFEIEFSNGRQLRESLDGLKTVIMVYEKQGEKVIGLGPIFNYKEGK